LKQKLTYTIY